MILEIILYTMLHKAMGRESLKEIGPETFAVNMMNVEFSSQDMTQVVLNSSAKRSNSGPIIYSIYETGA